MLFGRRKAVELLVAEAAAKKRALAAGLDPDETPEAKAVAESEAKIIAEQARLARWAQRIDGGRRRQPRGMSADRIAEATALVNGADTSA